MGVVYRALDRVLDEVVALKVLRADLLEGDEMARRFRSEIKLARRVGHRNVCRVFEYGEDGPVRYIAMELIDGVNLRHLITHAGGMPSSEAFETVLQAVAGLEAIHELGIVHRDLKSANIMRDRRGVVKLMDFGIARQRGGEGTDLTGTGGVVGTPEYMSPEQATGVKVDARSDIYSMGIIIYEVFAGLVPFRGETPVATILKHIQEPLVLDPSSGLPEALCPVLDRCLAKTPESRYPSTAVLRQALEAAREATFSEGATAAKLAVAPAAPDRGDTHTIHRVQPPAGVDLTLKPSPTQLPPTRPGARVRTIILVALGVAAAATIVYEWAFRPRTVIPPASPPISSSPAPGRATPQREPASTRKATPSPPSLPAPTPDRTSVIASRLERIRGLDAERAYGQLLDLAARYPEDRSLRGHLDEGRRRLVEHWIAQGQKALGQAASGTAEEEPYRQATDFFDRALELDPANAEAQSGRAAAARGPTPPRAPSDRVAFSLAKTTFKPGAIETAPPGMGQLPPGVDVRPAQPPTAQARIVIEIEPQPLRPGESYVARYYVFNESTTALVIMAASVKNRLPGGGSTGGTVDVKTKIAPPSTRTLLLETRDVWRHDPSASWATTLTLVLDDGSVYAGTLHTQP